MALSRAFARKLRTGLSVGIFVGGLSALAVHYRPTEGAQREGETPGAASIFLERLERRVFNWLARRQASERTPDPDIVVVALDDPALAALRSRLGAWPWMRTALGLAAREARLSGARLVVFDTTFEDPSFRGGTDDDDFAQLLDESGEVVAGFGFSGAEPAGASLKSGRWAVHKGSYATRGAALLAAAPMLARDARPYLVPSGDRVEVWLGGYRERKDAARDAERLRVELDTGMREQPGIRELTVEETLDEASIDVVFSERQAVRVEGAQALNLSLFEILQPPVAPLVSTGVRFGHGRMAQGEGGLARAVQHVVRYEGRHYPSLALAAALRLSGRDEVTIAGGRLEAGGAAAPVDGNGTTWLRLYGRRVGDRLEAPYDTVSFTDLYGGVARRMEGREPDAKLARRLAGKVVVLGFDDRLISYGRAAHVSGLVPPAMVTANALDNLLQGDGLRRASSDRDAAVAFFVAFLGALVSVAVTRFGGLRRSVAIQLFAGGLLAFGLVAVADQSFRAGVWIALAGPLLGLGVSLVATSAFAWVDEARLGGAVREALGRATSPAVVLQVLDNPQLLLPAGERRVATLLLSDMVGFGEWVEGMRPREAVRLLNDYFTALAGVIDRNRGQVDKMVRDGLSAFWGAPLPNHLHAVDACRCAVRIREMTVQKMAAWKERHGIEIRVRIGVNTGDVIVGDMGSVGDLKRTNYTVLGEAVDHAARLRRANRAYGTDILVGEGTYEAARDHIEVREIDLVRVKGRSRPVRVLELLGMRGDVQPRTRDLVERFDRALVAYRKREFLEATGILDALASDFPDDGPTRIYLDRCQHYLDEPPDEDWDGVWLLTPM